MKIEHYSLDKLKTEILEVLGEHLDLTRYRVFFFGSRVDGTADEHSDVDVGIEGPGPVPTEVWLDVQEEIENLPILHKVEIVDFRRTADVFREVALQHIETISMPK